MLITYFLWRIFCHLCDAVWMPPFATIIDIQVSYLVRSFFPSGTLLIIWECQLKRNMRIRFKTKYHNFISFFFRCVFIVQHKKQTHLPRNSCTSNKKIANNCILICNSMEFLSINCLWKTSKNAKIFYWSCFF